MAVDGRANRAPDLLATSSMAIFSPRFLRCSKPLRSKCCRQHWKSLETRSARELNWIQSERERLDHEEKTARERADLTRGDLPRVHRDALQRLENVLQEREEFERKIAFEQSLPKIDQSEEELEELCQLASDLPGLWHHPVVTHQERKEILRCLIDHIVVSATKERIDATIVWNNGEKTPIAIWRGDRMLQPHP